MVVYQLTNGDTLKVGTQSRSYMGCIIPTKTFIQTILNFYKNNNQSDFTLSIIDIRVFDMSIEDH